MRRRRWQATGRDAARPLPSVAPEAPALMEDPVSDEKLLNFFYLNQPNDSEIGHLRVMCSLIFLVRWRWEGCFREL